MATAYIYNGFGRYEERDGVRGITLNWARLPWFLPFEQVTTIPDWTLREVDWNASTPDGDEPEGRLVYKTFVIPGKRVAEELIMTQVPYKNRDLGIIEIVGKPTGNIISVPSGCMLDGSPMFSEVREVEVTSSERKEAEALALDFKKRLINAYFQSKRERMAGGKGQLFPIGSVKLFMDELNVEDIDDVSRHQRATAGVDPALISAIIEAVMKGQEINGARLLEAVETVRKKGQAQLTNSKHGRRSIGADEYREAYDDAIADGKTPEEAKELAELARG